VFGDPVVGGVEVAASHHDHRHARWYVHRSIGHHGHAELVAIGYFVGFVFYGAAIAVEVEVEHVPSIA